MRGAGLPAAMLCAILGMVLAFAPRPAIPRAVPLLFVTAMLASLIPIGGAHEWVFLGCWVSVIVIALSIHLPRGIPQALALVLATDAGLWAGGIIAAEGRPLDLLRALPWVLLVVPGVLLQDRKFGIAIKVASSWLIAVALLAALLPLTPTPGYVPDHME